MEEELRNVKLEFERVRREQKQEIKTLSTKVNTLEGNAKSLYGHNERLVTENLGLKKEKAELKEVSTARRKIPSCSHVWSGYMGKDMQWLFNVTKPAPSRHRLIICGWSSGHYPGPG